MGLFYRRPLCLFCLLFCLGALLGWQLGGVGVLWCMGAVAAIAVLLGIVMLALRRGRIPLLTVLLGTVMLLLALGQSFLAVTLPRTRASACVGEDQPVLVTVLSEEYSSEYSAQYLVRIRRLGERELSLRGRLVCDPLAQIGSGDEVVAYVTVTETAPDKTGAVLELYLEDTESARIRRMKPDTPLWEILSSADGITVLSERVRGAVGGRLMALLGEEQGALASGFLMGDSGELPPQIRRDFRRSGTSHQMAVSGLHVSILLGGIELLLRRLGMPKTGRCVTVSLLSVLFLCLTGFSASACRSVLMLYAVYVSYFVSEENDGVTALFVSIALILLVSPYSVADLGMWMSFLATLGLLTVYPLLEKRIPLPKGKRGMGERVLRLLRRVLLLALMTVVATVFLLPISWLFFGELSLVSVASNLILSPLCYVFLIGIPFVWMLGGIPLLGTALGWLLSGVGRAVLWVVRVFSQCPNATVSLKYPFVDWIMAGFTVVFTVLLVVRLRRKWLIGTVPVLTAVLFSVCVAFYHGMAPTPTVTYSSNGYGRELFVIEEGATLSFCDISDGGWGSYWEIKAAYEESVATEIEAVTLTHLGEEHVPVWDLLMRQVTLRRLYIPLREAERVPEIGQALWRIARDCGTEVILFDREASLTISDTVRAYCATFETDAHCAICLSFYAAEESLTYASPNICGSEWAESVARRMGQSDTVILGSHGTKKQEFYSFSLPEARIGRIVFSNPALGRQCALSGVECDVYAPCKEGEWLQISVPLP